MKLLAVKIDTKVIVSLSLSLVVVSEVELKIEQKSAHSIQKVFQNGKYFINGNSVGARPPHVPTQLDLWHPTCP